MPTHPQSLHFRSFFSVLGLILLLEAVITVTNAYASDSSSLKEQSPKLPAWRFTSKLPFVIFVETSKEKDDLRVIGRTPGTVEIPECSNRIFLVDLAKADISDYAKEIKANKIERLCFANVTDKKLDFLRKNACLDHVKNLELVGDFSDLKPLQNLKNLKLISLVGCQKVSNIKPLASLEGVTDLYLYNLPRLKDLSPLSSLVNLESLALVSCESLSDLTPLRHLNCLEELSFWKCKELSSLSLLVDLKNLKVLGLRDCEKISDEEISGLKEKLPSLKVREDFLPGAPY